MAWELRTFFFNRKYLKKCTHLLHKKEKKKNDYNFFCFSLVFDITNNLLTLEQPSGSFDAFEF